MLIIPFYGFVSLRPFVCGQNKIDFLGNRIAIDFFLEGNLIFLDEWLICKGILKEIKPININFHMQALLQIIWCYKNKKKILCNLISSYNFHTFQYLPSKNPNVSNIKKFTHRKNVTRFKYFGNLSVMLSC